MKRFTDTDLWEKEWFLKLSLKHKALIRFLFDKCDNAGVWKANWTLVSFYIGETIVPGDLKALGVQVEDMGGEKFFIPDFIEFQYGKLSEKCKPHIKVISLLKKHGLFDRVCKGYAKGMDTLEEEEKEEEKDKGGAGGESELPEDEMKKLWIETFGHNPKIPEMEKTNEFVKKWGLCKVRNTYKIAALRGIKSIAYMEENLTDNGDLKPYNKNDKWKNKNNGESVINLKQAKN